MTPDAPRTERTLICKVGQRGWEAGHSHDEACWSDAPRTEAPDLAGCICFVGPTVAGYCPVHRPDVYAPRTEAPDPLRAAAEAVLAFIEHPTIGLRREPPVKALRAALSATPAPERPHHELGSDPDNCVWCRRFLDIESGS